MRLIHLDIGEQGKVVACAKLVEVCAQKALERLIIASKIFQVCGVAIVSEQFNPIFFANWRFGRETAVLLIFGSEFARDHFAGLDIGLVEGIDTEDRTGYGSRDLPAEELLAKIVCVGKLDFHHRLPSLA